MAPVISPHELPDSAAQIAQNCMFGSVSLRPMLANGTAAVNSEDAFTSAPNTIFKYTNSRWLSWDSDVDVARSMVADLSDYSTAGVDRLYWTDPALAYSARMGSYTKIIGSTGSKPSSSYRLGIPKPILPIIATVAAPGPAADQQATSYIYTYVSLFGEEGPPSDPSNIVLCSPGYPIVLTNFSVWAAADYSGSVAADFAPYRKRIYKAITGSTGSDYQLCGEMVYTTTGTAGGWYPITLPTTLVTTGEFVLAADLGEVCPTSTWFPPPANIIGIKAHPAGFFVGYYNTDAAGILCFSAPYLPHAWEKQVVLDSPIVAIGMFGTSAVVVTNSFPVALTGGDPSSMTVERAETGEACTLKRGFVDMGYACIYPGISGLWAVSISGITLATDKILSKVEWDASYSPSSPNPMVFAAQYNNLYIAFQTTGGFVYDVQTGDFYKHSINATAAFTDTKTGELYYYLAANGLKKWGSGTAQLITWKSKKFRLVVPTNFSTAQVFAAGSVTINIYGDGMLFHTQTVTTSKPFRLPSGFKAVEWEIELQSYYEITSVFLASSIDELGKV